QVGAVDGRNAHGGEDARQVVDRADHDLCLGDALFGGGGPGKSCGKARGQRGGGDGGGTSLHGFLPYGPSGLYMSSIRWLCLRSTKLRFSFMVAVSSSSSAVKSTSIRRKSLICSTRANSRFTAST